MNDYVQNKLSLNIDKSNFVTDLPPRAEETDLCSYHSCKRKVSFKKNKKNT